MFGGRNGNADCSCAYGVVIVPIRKSEWEEAGHRNPLICDRGLGANFGCECRELHEFVLVLVLVCCCCCCCEELDRGEDMLRRAFMQLTIPPKSTWIPSQ